MKKIVLMLSAVCLMTVYADAQTKKDQKRKDTKQMPADSKGNTIHPDGSVLDSNGNKVHETRSGTSPDTVIRGRDKTDWNN